MYVHLIGKTMICNLYFVPADLIKKGQHSKEKNYQPPPLSESLSNSKIRYNTERHRLEWSILSKMLHFRGHGVLNNKQCVEFFKLEYVTAF